MKSNSLLLVATVLLLVALTSMEGVTRIIPSEIKLVDTLPGDDPYLTHDHKGRPVISWVRKTSRKTAVFCYAVSNDNGRSFGKPVVVPESDNIYAHAENMPKVIFKSSGDIIAIWGARNPNPENKYSGLIYYSQSFDGGKSWTKARRLVADKKGNDQRFADVALLKNGEVGVIWLDDRKQTVAEGSAVYFASTSGRNGFMNEQLISEPSCQCCRTSLFTDSRGNIHVLYRGIINDSIRDMIHLVSQAGGLNFSRPKKILEDNWVLRGCPHTGPAMTESAGRIHFAWFTGARSSGCFYTSTEDNGKSFRRAEPVTRQGSHPQLAALRTGEVAIVWDETDETPDGFYKRIGFQLRNAKGTKIQQEFITPNTIYSTYPVVGTYDDHTMLVAFCMKRNNQNHIGWQIVNLK